MFKIFVLSIVIVATSGSTLLSIDANGRQPSDEETTPDMPKVAAFDEAKVKSLLAGGRGGERMRSLLKSRHDAAVAEVETRTKAFLAGRATLDILLTSTERLLRTELDMSATKADQMAARETHLQLMKKLHEISETRFKAGRIPTQDLKQTEFYRFDAEIALERAKARPVVISGD